MPTLECVAHREGYHHRLVFHLSCGMRAYASQAVIIACMRCRILHTQSIFLSQLPCAGLFFDVSPASSHPHSPLPPAHPSCFRFLLILLFFFVWEVGSTALASATRHYLDVSLACDGSTFCIDTLCRL
uniref:Uncharacterized protein n=1 Tax=Trypanosoma congolense (strain IL3000) TaxID=1068625 RepID=G0V3F9_TRYCI|nr:hypothetical protein, unlikely [Trypanosoma congolense IL3000]